MILLLFAWADWVLQPPTYAKPKRPRPVYVQYDYEQHGVRYTNQTRQIGPRSWEHTYTREKW